MYCKAYKERLEEQFQVDLREEEEQEVEQDPQVEEHQYHLPTFPNNLHNLPKMSR